MSDISEPPLARAAMRPSRRLSAIWVIPVVAIAIGLWLAWDTLSKRGPVITITFDNAEGLQAGQSQLKFKDIVFGTVQRFVLSPDHSKVIVTVETTHQATPLLTDKAQFWVVKPRLFAGNLSGFNTLLSGSYIGMLPGTEAGHAQRHFVGREEPPVLQTNVAGHVFLLKAARLGSVSLGSPVFFRDLDVGQVLGWDIGRMARSVTIHVFVRAPFDSYVHDETRFWNASGASIKMAGTGVQLQVESLRALLLGGVAFETPDADADSATSSQNHVFPLFADRATAQAASYRRKVQVVSYFGGSVSGLGPGSPVTVQGLTVGHVTDVRLIYDPVKRAVLAPVRYEIEPERVLGIGAKRVYGTTAEAVQALINRGLRAKLQSVSIITGQQAVALEFVRDAPQAKVAMEDGIFVLPATGSGGLGGIEESASALLEKVNAIPFGQIGKNLDGILAAANGMTSGPETRKAVADLASSLAGVKDLVQKLDNGLAPAVRQLPGLTTSLQKTTSNFSRLAASMDNAYGDNTRFNRDLERAMIQLNEALAAVRELADLLTRHPEALIRGRAAGGVQ